MISRLRSMKERPRPSGTAVGERRESHRTLLERVTRADFVTCGGGGEGLLTCGVSSWSIPVATPRFSMSCGIFTGSPGVRDYNHLASVFGPHESPREMEAAYPQPGGKLVGSGDARRSRGPAPGYDG
jgi:hypothetical protein